MSSTSYIDTTAVPVDPSTSNSSSAKSNASRHGPDANAVDNASGVQGAICAAQQAILQQQDIVRQLHARLTGAFEYPPGVNPSQLDAPQHDLFASLAGQRKMLENTIAQMRHSIDCVLVGPQAPFGVTQQPQGTNDHETE